MRAENAAVGEEICGGEFAVRKLLNVLYVTTPDAYLSLDGENVVVRKDDADLRRLPLHNLEGIVTFGYTGASPALMSACAERGVSLSFMTKNGRFLARVQGAVTGNVLLRREQYRLADDEQSSLTVAKNTISGKLFNARWVLERTTRDHALRVDVANLKNVSDALRRAIDAVQASETLDQLRGLEGEAAQLYFGVFNELILQQEEDFVFAGRNRRPPLDRVNALLSFAYSLLTGDVTAALEGVGLDPYVGFLHRDRPGRASLSLDMMEELRAVVADRFVLSLINRREVTKAGFATRENGAVMMDDATRKTVLTAWQTRKQETLTHPFLNEKIPWGLVPHAQSLLLARYIRGDLDAYPPFLWK
jgi:CRISPR-associated protein Cas1